MSAAWEQHVERIQAVVEHWGAARRNLDPEELAAFRRDTVNELNRHVRDLHGIDEADGADA